jgi:hypothetical protein
MSLISKLLSTNIYPKLQCAGWPNKAQIDLSSNEEFIRVPKDIISEIFTYLDPNDISKASLVRRSFGDVTKNNNYLLWKNLLVRDFGEKKASMVKDNRYREAYIQYHEKLKNFITNLPKGKLLLRSYENDLSKKICGLVPPRNIEQYVDVLSIEELSQVFCESAKEGFIPLMKAIMNSPRFAEITANGNDEDEYCLGYAAGWAAQFGQVEPLELIMKNCRFSEINANGSNGLGAAFGAACGGFIEIMELIMKNPRFSEINANGSNGLGEAFANTIISKITPKSYLKAMKLIMEDKRFKEIDPNDSLMMACFAAIYFGRLDALKIIKADDHFGKIDQLSDFSLWIAPFLAAMSGNDQLLDFVKNDPSISPKLGSFTSCYLLPVMCRLSSFWKRISE